MSARKRQATESFEQYRANLKGEAAILKTRKQGTFAHISKPLYTDKTGATRVSRSGSTFVHGTGSNGHINRQF